jgi:hypothetical protein
MYLYLFTCFLYAIVPICTGIIYFYIHLYIKNFIYTHLYDFGMLFTTILYMYLIYLYIFILGEERFFIQHSLFGSTFTFCWEISGCNNDPNVVKVMNQIGS